METRSPLKVTALPGMQGEGAAPEGEVTPVPEPLSAETFQDTETLSQDIHKSHFSRNLLLLHSVSESPSWNM